MIGDPADRMGLNPLERNRILNFTELFNDFVSQQIQHKYLAVHPEEWHQQAQGGGESLCTKPTINQTVISLCFLR